MIVNEISLVIQRIIEDGKEKGNTKGNSLDVREIPSLLVDIQSSMDISLRPKGFSGIWIQLKKDPEFL